MQTKLARRDFNFAGPGWMKQNVDAFPGSNGSVETSTTVSPTFRAAHCRTKAASRKQKQPEKRKHRADHPRHPLIFTGVLSGHKGERGEHQKKHRQEERAAHLGMERSLTGEPNG